MNSELTRVDHIARRDRIPEKIIRISQNNPLIHNLVQMFVSGQIITLEEMLCQMVVCLNHDWGKMAKDYVDYIRMTSMPIKPIHYQP